MALVLPPLTVVPAEAKPSAPPLATRSTPELTVIAPPQDWLSAASTSVPLSFLLKEPLLTPNGAFNVSVV